MTKKPDYSQANHDRIAKAAAAVSKLPKPRAKVGPVPTHTLAMKPTRANIAIETTARDHQLLLEIVIAWESLEGGRQVSHHEVERWLANKMSPVLDRIRTHLGMTIPSKREMTKD